MSNISLKILRSVGEIGGNCIEITTKTTRILLDIGMPLNAIDGVASLPDGLDINSPCDGVLISHPHQDHWGLLHKLPRDWKIYSGKHCATLINKTTEIIGKKISHDFHDWQSGKKLKIGDIEITPYLTDHSAFDAYMLLLEHDGKRVLYTGDFRLHGRKSKLVERMITSPPQGIDALIMEGTNVGTSKPTKSESELEQDFVDHFNNSDGRVFINWSAQNIDRTITIYRACLKSRRNLVVDLYTADIMESLKDDFKSLPRVGWNGFHAFVSYNLARLYNNKSPDLINNLKTTGKAHSARALQNYLQNSVIMVRANMIENFIASGIILTPNDSFVWSNWSGYLKDESQKPLLNWFDDVGVAPIHIHTSGHASQEALIKFVNAISPKKLIPIHGENWKSGGEKNFPNILHLENNSILQI